jgi:hypothetical protein
VNKILTDHSGSFFRIQLNCPAGTDAMPLSVYVTDAIAGVVSAPPQPDDTVKYEITRTGFSR